MIPKKMMKWNYKLFGSILLLLCVCSIIYYFFIYREKISIEMALYVSEFEEYGETEVVKNPYSELCVPTYVNKVEDTYFIVDCYNNQVIYNDDLKENLTDWSVMTSEMNRGHTIVSDGIVYLIDDTENNQILIYEKRNKDFIHTQTLKNIGIRPHFIVYEEETDTFYAWSSMTGELFYIHRNKEDNQVYVSDIRAIDKLNNVYVRSFTIIDGEVYFVSGTSSIIVADLKSLQIKREYPVSDEIAGMIQLVKIQDYYYITVSTDKFGNQDYATFLRTKDLKTLEKGEFEDIYHHFVGGGTPYYISYFEDTYYLTEHRVPGHSVWSFNVQGNDICNVTAIY